MFCCQVGNALRLSTFTIVVMFSRRSRDFYLAQITQLTTVCHPARQNLYRRAMAHPSCPLIGERSMYNRHGSVYLSSTGFSAWLDIILIHLGHHLGRGLIAIARGGIAP